MYSSINSFAALKLSIMVSLACPIMNVLVQERSRYSIHTM